MIYTDQTTQHNTKSSRTTLTYWHIGINIDRKFSTYYNTTIQTLFAVVVVVLKKTIYNAKIKIKIKNTLFHFIFHTTKSIGSRFVCIVQYSSRLLSIYTAYREICLSTIPMMLLIRWWLIRITRRSICLHFHRRRRRHRRGGGRGGGLMEEE